MNAINILENKVESLINRVEHLENDNAQHINAHHCHNKTFIDYSDRIAVLENDNEQLKLAHTWHTAYIKELKEDVASLKFNS